MCGNIYTASAWRLIRFMIWDSTESAVWDAPWQGRTAGQSFDYSRPTNGHIYDPLERCWMQSMLVEERRNGTPTD